jgi:hypothetical protein
MTEEHQIHPAPHGVGAKPRLVLMGEFSAGKSTLSNILLGSNPLPMRVTATRLPPVVISHGPSAAFAIGKDGTRVPIALDALETVPLSETQSIELFMESEILELCDIVDMPGISDPDMPLDVWQNVVGANDLVIWCTHATQAWRKSEAAIWDSLRAASSGRNLLLVTQFDKLRNPRDQNRVLKRVARETEGLFEQIYPVSLLTALEAGDDFEAWKTSGAADFIEHVIGSLMDFGEGLSGLPAPVTQDDDEWAARAMIDSAPLDTAHDDGEPDPAPLQTEGSVRPRRVRLNPDSGSRRNPERRAAASGGF